MFLASEQNSQCRAQNKLTFLFIEFNAKMTDFTIICGTRAYFKLSYKLED